MSAADKARMTVGNARDRAAMHWRESTGSLPRLLRTAEIAGYVLSAAAFIWMYRDTPAVAGVLIAGAALAVACRRAHALLYPIFVAAAVFGADAGTMAARFLLLSLVIALWHIDGLRHKGAVYAVEPALLLRGHAIWLAAVLLVSGTVVIAGTQLTLELPGWLAILLVPAVVVVTAQLARSRTDAHE